MFRLSLLATIALFSVLAIRADDQKELTGEWTITKAVIDGKEMTDAFKTAVLTLKDGKYSLAFGGMKDEGTITFDEKKSPKQMDIKGTEGPNKDKTILCIYELKDEVLTVCYSEGKERPGKFESSKESKIFLISYKKKK